MDDWLLSAEGCNGSVETSSCSRHKTQIKHAGEPLCMETNTNGKHVIILRLLIKSSCREVAAFYTQRLFNKQVCLTYSGRPVVTGCSPPLCDCTGCLLCPSLEGLIDGWAGRRPGPPNLQLATAQEALSQHSSIKILASEVHIRLLKTLQFTTRLYALV